MNLYILKEVFNDLINKFHKSYIDKMMKNLYFLENNCRYHY